MQAITPGIVNLPKTRHMRKLLSDELGRPDIPSFKQMAKMPVVAVLDNIRSMHNVGSIFRSADAFAIESIYLCGITACPPHREIHKTALGATESVEWHYFKDTMDCLILLQNKGYELVCVEQTDRSEKLHLFEPSEKTALVFGNELDGVSQEVLTMCHRAIELPQAGTKHSLNVSVCAGIVFWEFYQIMFAT